MYKDSGGIQRDSGVCGGSGVCENSGTHQNSWHVEDLGHVENWGISRFRAESLGQAYCKGSPSFLDNWTSLVKVCRSMVEVLGNACSDTGVEGNQFCLQSVPQR